MHNTAELPEASGAPGPGPGDCGVDALPGHLRRVLAEAGPVCDDHAALLLAAHAALLESGLAPAWSAPVCAALPAAATPVPCPSAALSAAHYKLRSAPQAPAAPQLYKLRSASAASLGQVLSTLVSGAEAQRGSGAARRPAPASARCRPAPPAPPAARWRTGCAGTRATRGRPARCPAAPCALRGSAGSCSWRAPVRAGPCTRRAPGRGPACRAPAAPPVPAFWERRVDTQYQDDSVSAAMQ